ncbi:MCE family protein [Skermania piniformis]|uniref:MCE family protein n=1 Tax=Skermania pinensis TaxID=39122 RepID=A0ABX8SAY9_9ACTN|nr:MCE family protein [Skermania piniformis]QXQ13730.1 MCE family protein [Skermania piniformis]
MKSKLISTTAKVLTICALGAASACSASNPFAADKMNITADFENIAGMYPGNPVSVLGLPVGKIDSVEPKGTFVEVRMSIDPKVKVPADAIAAQVSPSLVTNRHVELTPAYSGNGPMLADGDHIPLQRTRTPVELDRVLQTVDDLASALKGDGKEGPLSGGVLVKALEGNGQKINDTVKALSSTIDLTVTNRDALTNSIVKLNELTQTIQDNQQALQNFSGQVTTVSGMLAEQAPGLQAVLQQLDIFLANTSTVLATKGPELTSSLNNLTQTTDLLKRNAWQLTEVVDVTPLLMQNVANAIDYGQDGGAIRLHAQLERNIFDGELISLFCERVKMQADGCRTGKMSDFGPDFGLTAALMGMTQ